MKLFSIIPILLFLNCNIPNGLFNKNEYTEHGAIGGNYGIEVTVQTKSYGGEFGQNNVAVIWIEDSNGKFIKTIGIWALNYPDALVTWQEKKSTDEIDGITSASRINHQDELTGQWDLRDMNGDRVSNGSYVIKVEFTEDNAGSGPTFSSSCNITVNGNASSSTGQISEFITKFNVVYNP